MEENKSLVISNKNIEIAQVVDNKIKSLLKSGYTGLALTIAKGEVCKAIEQFLDDEKMEIVLSMKGKQYGFKTDEATSGAYSKPIVKDCVVMALLSGVEITNNEFNILSGNCYITKNGVIGILKKMGVWHEVSFGTYQTKETATGAKFGYMPVTIKWMENGKLQSKDLDMPVNKFDKTKEEALRGQAGRDARQWLIEKITGTALPTGDTVSDVDLGYAEEVKTTEIHETKKQTNPETKEQANTDIKQQVEVLGEVINDTALTKKQEDKIKYINACTTLDALMKIKDRVFKDEDSQTVLNEFEQKRQQLS